MTFNLIEILRVVLLIICLFFELLFFYQPSLKSSQTGEDFIKNFFFAFYFSQK